MLPWKYKLFDYLLQTMQKHYQSLGGFTFALRPYWENNITMLLADPDRAALLTPHEDMLSYVLLLPYFSLEFL